MSVSFEGIGERCVTFCSDPVMGVIPYAPCKLSDNGMVAFAEEDDRFMGWVVNTVSGYCTVQTEGYVEAIYSGTAPEVGYAYLLSDGEGSVCVDSGTEGVYTGGEYLIVKVDTTNNIVGFFL